ncbi:MAG: type VI secretion protein, partial [Lysobacteraceae bacterium]
ATALILMTIWIFFQGLRIVTGQARDSMMALVVNSLKATLIIAAATSVGVLGSDMHDFITEDMQGVITELVTGEEDVTAQDQIDKNLAYMQLAMSSIEAIKVLDDPALLGEKNRALWMVGIGTAGPAMTGGAMLLLYEIALALFVGLGPLFILCLLFDATKSLFQRWLLYGIGTMFSLAVLAAMVAIATKVVIAVAAAFWATALIGNLLLGDATLNQGMTAIAMQQGGIGLLLTVILISTPPMAAGFFQGTLGNFLTYAQVGSEAKGGGGGRGGGDPRNPGPYHDRDGGYDGRASDGGVPMRGRPRGEAADAGGYNERATVGRYTGAEGSAGPQTGAGRRAAARNEPPTGGGG